MRSLFLVLILVFGCQSGLHAQQKPFHFSSPEAVQHIDLEYFFDSITLEKGGTRFELSRNAMGMLWRVKTDKTDVTGVCNYRQTVSVPLSASLEIKWKDISLELSPEDSGTFSVRLHVKGKPPVFNETTQLQAKSDGTYSVITGTD